MKGLPANGAPLAGPPPFGAGRVVTLENWLRRATVAAVHAIASALSRG